MSYRAGFFAGLLILLCGALPCRAQDREATNPFTSPEDVAAGAKMFRSHCANCHGHSGKGGRGPDLTRGQLRRAQGDAALFKIVETGIPSAGMPGLYRSENAIWQVVAFMRSLSAGAKPAPLAGDPAAGEALFWGKGECGTCHRVRGRGGRLGPDLSDIGWLRSPEHLRVSLLDPNEEVPPRWWTLRLTHRDGAITEGLRMDEDTFSVRIMDLEENLHSFLKEDLQELERIEESTMPVYGQVLEARQVDDLIAFLYSLREAGL